MPWLHVSGGGNTNDGVDIIGVGVEVEQLFRAECKRERILVLAKMVVDFGSDEGGELALREGGRLVENLDLGEVV